MTSPDPCIIYPMVFAVNRSSIIYKLLVYHAPGHLMIKFFRLTITTFRMFAQVVFCGPDVKVLLENRNWMVVNNYRKVRKVCILPYLSISISISININLYQNIYQYQSLSKNLSMNIIYIYTYTFIHLSTYLSMIIYIYTKDLYIFPK